MTTTQSISREKLKHHLIEEHKISPLSTYLKEIVYGGTDGIVTTFAVVSGFTGAQAQAQASIPSLPMLAVLLFGTANLLADGTSMALGNFLSVRSDQDVYRGEQKKELHEIRTNPKMERAETIQILKQKGFSDADARRLTDLYAKNEAYWLEFMMKDELEMSNPIRENPVYTGLATFVSFVLFGLIPLVPYFLAPGSVHGTFVLSTLSALAALVLLGVLRWRVTKTSIGRSVGETVLLGSIAGAVAFVVGSFFRT